MRDCFTMWRHTRMVTLTAVCAAIYAAVLIPTQVIPIVPGFTNLRPGNAVAIVLSLLFGPAGAWGAAFGNTVNDFFGTFGPGTWFGFLGNFLFGLIPYKLWRIWGGGTLPPRDTRGWTLLVVVILIASCACALLVGWGVHLLGFAPFPVLGWAVLGNNVVCSLVLAPPLLAALAPRVRRWGLTYDEIMDDHEIAARPLGKPASLVMTLVIVAAFAAGTWLAFGGGDASASGGITPAGPSGSLGLLLLPAVLLIFLLAGLL